MPTKRKRQGQAPGEPPSPWAHHPFDRVLKVLAEHDPQGFLAWLVEVLKLPPTTLIDGKRSKELVASEQAVDILWLVEVGAERELLHVECEVKDEKGRMGERLAAYALQLYKRDRLPVHPIVLYIRRKPSVSLPPFVIGTTRRAYLRCDFDAVKMWEVAPETVLRRPAPYLWPLVGLMAGITPTRVLEVAEQIVLAVPTRHEQKELVGMLVVLAGIQLSKAEIEAIRRHPMVNELWKESSAAQVLLEEGRAEEARKIARAVLTRRFGSPPEEVLAAIDAADEATLLEIIENMSSGESLEQVRTRLGV